MTYAYKLSTGVRQAVLAGAAAATPPLCSRRRGRLMQHPNAYRPQQSDD